MNRQLNWSHMIYQKDLKKKENVKKNYTFIYKITTLLCTHFRFDMWNIVIYYILFIIDIKNK